MIEHKEPIPLSALQHWCYCPRQCALIHVEQVFSENIHTLRGRAVHATVDSPGVETRDDVRVERALPIWSERLGLIGKADVVEFHADGTAYPVEYKHGSRRKNSWIVECDELQLAAQAMCLEEMMNRPVGEGAIYYARSKRRRVVSITPTLRVRVEEATVKVREILRQGLLPEPANDSRCEHCSLKEACQPQASGKRSPKDDVLARLLDPDL